MGANAQGRTAAASSANNRQLVRRLLSWYDRSGRDLPWRIKGRRRANPYHVWLSEIMLQQTTVRAVIPYFERFVLRWPTVHDLAGAALDDVLHGWQGLGYYGRARNLHKCARLIAADHGGRFPDREEALRTLPGIGPYTAAAIAAIAFGRSATVVDGNVERVMARFHAVTEQLPGARPRLGALAQRLTPASRAGDFAQAVMDLGATICLPRTPQCGVCPWSSACLAHARGLAGELPRRASRRKRSLRHAIGFWLERRDGAVLFERRPEEGLLGGMMALPMTPWRDGPWPLDEALAQAPMAVDWHAVDGPVHYGFTHFDCEIRVLKGRAPGRRKGPDGGQWRRLDELETLALPSLTKKVVRHTLAAAPDTTTRGRQAR